ncbi:MAG: peptidoglycan DD-metalloendopeptidase family protein [Ignavibacteriaceae bacterium]
MVKISAYIYILLILCSPDLIPQEGEQIKLKQNELSDLKKEISGLEAEIKTKTKKEKESYAVLENYSRQNYLLNKIINELHAEEKLKQAEINKSESEIASLEKEIEALKDNYARYVVAIYKNGKASELAGIFNSGSFRQALLRYKYLQRFSASREKDLKQLKLNKEQLLAAKARLEQEKKEKEIFADQKENEEKVLKVKLDERKVILNKIKNDKASLKKELDSKKNAETKIRNLITKLIEDAERRRKEEEERLAKLDRERLKNSESSSIEKRVEKKSVPASDYNLDLSTSGFSSFSALKGRLNWPILGGKIIRKFGENRNVKLNTVTLNYGVDIAASSDLNVKAVAEGIISAIDWIPGYGSIIIITHKDDFRTVYSHLAEIFVKEGDRVKMGSLIAKVGESLEGNILHFEIWNSRSNQNPETWLAKK